MFKQDYLLKQISQMTKVVLKIFFGLDVDKEGEEYDFEDVESLTLFNDLKSMVDIGKIGDAEDKMFDVIENNMSRENLKTALLFYDYLNRKDDDFLEMNNFSRKEIEMGVKDVIKMYEIEEDVNKLLL